MIRLVIFDCDGVLVDSERVCVAEDVRILAELGWPLSRDEVVARFLGRSLDDMVADVAARLGRPQPGLAETIERRYLEALRRDVTAVPGVRDVLADLPYEVAVATSATRSRATEMLTLTGLARFFGDRIFTADEVAAGKPAPDLFLHAAAACGAPPEKCAVVEDSVPGVRAARAAGMSAFGYASEFVTADRLADAGATVFTDMRELRPLLDGARDVRAPRDAGD